MRSFVGRSAPKCGFAKGGAFWIVALLLASAANSPGQIVKTINEYPVPTADSAPAWITPGPDGALWFTETVGNNIGRVTTSGEITEYPVPTVGSQPGGITAGPDGALWFTEIYGNNIGHITAIITEYPVPTAYSEPYAIAAGPDGALWFTEAGWNASKIGRITTSGAITEYTLPTAYSGPQGITAGPDGALWFAEYYGNKIGRITTSGVITEYAVPTAAGDPGGITGGPDGALWFTERDGAKIGRITTSGTISEYPVPTPGSYPWGIAAGPDGALWFTEAGAKRIGRITTSGSIIEYRVPAHSAPAGMTVGSDGALWFTEYLGNKIGQVVLDVSPRQGFARPIPMGVSVSDTPTPSLTVGTAGLLVHSVGEASKFILSNNHVLGAVAPTLCPSTAVKGETWTLQPGTLDIGSDPGNDPSYYVGVVADYWQLSKTGKNVIDAAVSATSLSSAGSDILGIGQPKGVARSAGIGEGVVKSGRTTGVTVGTVLDINCTTKVNYGKVCGIYTFTGQIAIFGVSPGAFSADPQLDGNPFSRGGDSGSAVLDAGTSTPVGLLFSGDPLLTYANPISAVYTSLRVFPDIPGGGGPKSAEELKAMDDLMQETLDPRLARLEEIQARHEDQLLSVEGVNGVCISLGESPQEFVFHVHVTKRTPELEQAIPREIEGVPVRLVETGGPIKAY